MHIQRQTSQYNHHHHPQYNVKTPLSIKKQSHTKISAPIKTLVKRLSENRDKLSAILHFFLHFGGNLWSNYGAFNASIPGIPYFRNKIRQEFFVNPLALF